ncbi:MAG: response regulator [Ardenticatenales bacterium]|nr:response regulator [Ardenticatenales bacterium]
MSNAILIVEDDAPLRHLLLEVFSEAGYLVRGAADGVAALDEVHRHPPALIILDEQMPHLDGWGFVAALEAQGVRQQFPILVLSASNRHVRAHCGGGASGQTV